MNKEPIYHSDIFWHFCVRAKIEAEAFKSLCDILNEKLLKRSFHNSAPFEEPIKDHEGKHTPTWRIQYVCFADIPFAFLKHHIERYGNVGLGFKKEFIIKKGGQPVLYTPYLEKNGKQKPSLFSISAIIEQWGREWSQIIKKYQIKPAVYRDLGWKIQALRKYIKQFSFEDANCAYYEREWRVINTFEFEEEDVVKVIFPERFTNEFISLFPNIPYDVSELILT
jgi:hypothetical protein